MTSRGRPESSTRRHVEQMGVIDIKGMALAPPTYTDSEFLQAAFRHGQPVEATGPREADLTVTWRNGQQQRLRIPVTLTTPHFGGVRQWFICPGCQGRVRKLYSPGPMADFRCRKCYGLLYRSQFLGKNPMFQLLRFFRLL